MVIHQELIGTLDIESVRGLGIIKSSARIF